MTTLRTLFKTRDCVTHTDYRLIEVTHVLGTKSYQVVIAEKNFRPHIRAHTELDPAVRDYCGTVASECATLGSENLVRELEEFPKYTCGDEPFEDARIMPFIAPPISPEVFSRNHSQR